MEGRDCTLASQQKAAAAIANGRLDEIVPIEVKKKKETVIFDTDEYVKPNTTWRSSALRPAFKKDGGTVTAGNASGINDAGAANDHRSEEFVKANGLKPLAKVRAWGSVRLRSVHHGRRPDRVHPSGSVPRRSDRC